MFSTIKLLSKDVQWRVRVAVLLLTVTIGLSSSASDFQRTFDEIFIISFEDYVSKVREQSVNGLKNLCEHFKQEWVIHTVIPKLLEI